MTKAVTTEECLNPPTTPQGRCNLCGLVFTPPMPHHSGNFFASRCSYVRKLLSPVEYREIRGNLAWDTVQMLNSTVLVNELYNNKLDEYHMGLDRYAAEQWAGSHPDLVPCDMTAKYGVYQYFQENEIDGGLDIVSGKPSSLFAFSMYPEYAIGGNESYIRAYRKESLKAGRHNDKRFRIREYGFLAGNLHRWITLYNSTPPAESWVWRYYPDAAEWQEGIEKYGLERVVEEMTGPYVGTTKRASQTVSRRLESLFSR